VVGGVEGTVVTAAPTVTGTTALATVGADEAPDRLAAARATRGDSDTDRLPPPTVCDASSRAPASGGTADCPDATVAVVATRCSAG